MFGFTRSIWILAGLWAIVVVTALLARPLLPLDETRYIAVAWDMWNSGDYLLPRLNGEIYSHKPPLLFWLINAAWMIFGVHEWVARLVTPAFGFFDLLLVGALARALWPDDDRAHRWAAPALLACPAFALYSSLLMFDAMLTFFVLVALLGIFHLSRTIPRNAVRACALIAIGVGGGILSKGPVVLVYLLPVAIAAPWWSPALRSAWKRFAAWLVLGIFAGTLVALAWAIPAAIAGGPEYREAILWTQTAGRVTQTADHARPFWFYLALLPAVFFPLLYVMPLRPMLPGTAWRDEGLRMCAAWCLGSLVLLSLVGGKQAHYLLPLFPAVALLAARAASLYAEKTRRPAFAAAVYGLVAAALLAATAALPADVYPQFSAGIGAVAGMAAVGIAGIIMLLFGRTARHTLWWGAASSSFFLASLQLMIGPSLRQRYDMLPFAKEVAKHVAAGTPIMHRGDYHGQYNFAGRLKEPLLVEKDEDTIPAWCAAHPGGLVIWYWKPGKEPFAGASEFTRHFRGRDAGLVRADAIAPRE